MELINVIGLILNVFGMGLIYFFGIQKISREEAGEGQMISDVGFYLFILGLLIQILTNYIG